MKLDTNSILFLTGKGQKNGQRFNKKADKLLQRNNGKIERKKLWAKKTFLQLRNDEMIEKITKKEKYIKIVSS